MKTAISILVQQDAPKDVRPEYSHETFEKKVQRCIRAVESNQISSETEWKYLKKLYEILSKRPDLSAKWPELHYELEELVSKYGKHDHSESAKMDAQTMNKYPNDARYK